ncbi:hybrid sensor histidine kinase/response regulator [Bacillus massiliigorillae]|uniref:hybrid sensor histidine kinase/response regulator n=1 Tax=Bacillus massiliigorillae TaxID=1243664 RepID=UPI00039D2139|nr:ATP-binding protein [Bacillus massiliigorillae]
MEKKKIVVIVCLFICVLLVFRFSWIIFYQKSDNPKIEKGVLDLRNTTILENEAVTLNGEWEFYKGNLIKSSPRKSSVPHTLVTVPEEEEKFSGKGTYRIRILLNEDIKQSYSFYFREIKSASIIYINGKRINELETGPTSKVSSLLNFRPYEVLVDDDSKEIELLIQVKKDAALKSGGLLKPIKFGTYSAMKKEMVLTFMMQLLSISILFFHGIYVLIIFCFFVRKKELLYLSAAFFCMTIAVLVDDDKLLFYLFPSISYEHWLIILFVSYTSAMFSLIQFTRYIIEEFNMSYSTLFRSSFIFRIFYILFLVSICIQPVMKYNYLFFTVVMIYGALIFIKTLHKGILLGQKDFIYILLAVISVTSSTIWGIVKNKMYLEYPYYPFDLIIGVFIFSALWFKRFFQVTKESKELALELQKIDKTRDEFLANTSHELRNPLHGIINITQTIYESEKDNLKKENKENLQLLLKVGRSMSLILNDLLDITKLKGGTVQLQIGTVNLSSVVSSVLDMLRFMTEGKNLTFELHISKTFPNIRADENRLFQILFNLIHNAVKYTNDGTIKVVAKIEDGVAEIQVEDTGIGMNQESLKSIFKPFEQIDSSMTAIGGGIGLGLNICEQLVKLHGGTLSVKSFVGVGSTFTFTLPIAEDVETAPEFEVTTPLIMKEEKVQDKSQAPKNKELCSVLVVDDDSINLSILESVLVSEHYNVVTCTNGQAALTLLNTGIWDLVITDVMMPNMSGYELTRRIRERYSITELPILLLTARSQIEDIQAGYYYGANDYVTKPVEQLELKARVKVLTELRNSVNERIRMEAAWLQAQIQPHFLFNTLNTIAALSTINPSKMMDLLDEFGNYLRACFDTQNLNQVIPLNREIKLVRSYLFIQQQRFNERLQVEWEADEDVFVQIPPLSIQTLVENAIRHGVLKHPNGGKICIQIIDMREEVQVSIMDNGVGISKDQLQRLLTNQQKNVKQGIGLLNTDKRLKQLYGRGLEISSIQNFGTTVRFIIPKIRDL